MEERIVCKGADDFAHWIHIADPFNASSYVAWLDRWNDNNGRSVSEDGSFAPAEM